jgi:hypothetical protein
MNELEEAYLRALRDPGAQHEFFQQLRKAVLSVPMPYHSEIAGTYQLGNGDVIPFSVWHLNGKDFVPVFTSSDRAKQALTATDSMDPRLCLAEIHGGDLFYVLANQEVSVVINPACGLGEMFLDLRAVAKLADDSDEDDQQRPKAFPPSLAFLTQLLEASAEEREFVERSQELLQRVFTVMQAHRLDPQPFILTLVPVLRRAHQAKAEADGAENASLEKMADAMDAERELFQLLRPVVEALYDHDPCDPQIQDWKKQLDEMAKRMPKQ